MSTSTPASGRYFEDFEVGAVYRCPVGRTITQADNTWFTLLTNNTNQIHFNDDYASRTSWGRCLVNSALTLSVVAGLGVADFSANGFALGWDEIKLPHPVFAGDTLYSMTEVMDVRPSKSRPEQGIVRVRTTGLNQDGVTVIQYVRSAMIWKRSHAPTAGLFPTPAPAGGDHAE